MPLDLRATWKGSAFATNYLFLQIPNDIGVGFTLKPMCQLTSYTFRFGNTICGRHPIGVFLNMVAEVKRRRKWENEMCLKCGFSSSECLFLSFSKSHPFRITLGWLTKLSLSDESKPKQWLWHGSQIPQLCAIQSGENRLCRTNHSLAIGFFRWKIHATLQWAMLLPLL